MNKLLIDWLIDQTVFGIVQASLIFARKQNMTQNMIAWAFCLYFLSTKVSWLYHHAEHCVMLGI